MTFAPRPILAAVALCCACAGPGEVADAEATDPRDAGRTCGRDVCLEGALGGEEHSFVAGWWGPALGLAEPSMTGGFTASVDVLDACEEVQAVRPPPDGWSFSFLVRDRDGDDDGDGLPDPGDYPIRPGWEDEHGSVTFAELLVGRAEGGLSLPDTLATGAGGTLTLVDVEPDGRVTGALDATFEGGAGRVSGSFRVDHCRPVP